MPTARRSRICCEVRLYTVPDFCISPRITLGGVPICTMRSIAGTVSSLPPVVGAPGAGRRGGLPHATTDITAAAASTSALWRVEAGVMARILCRSARVRFDHEGGEASSGAAVRGSCERQQDVRHRLLVLHEHQLGGRAGAEEQA